MSTPEPPQIPPGPVPEPRPPATGPGSPCPARAARPPAEAFVVRIKAGTVARKGRGRWLVWVVTIFVALGIWYVAQPWFSSSPQPPDDRLTEPLDEDSGFALLQFVAYLLFGLIVVALLFALQALWMFLFELVMPRRLRISAEGIDLVRGLRRVRLAWPRIASVEIVPVTGTKPRPALVVRPVFDYTAPDPFAGQRLSWTTARSPWRDKATDTIGLCCLDELNTTPGHLDAALRHFAPRPAAPGQ
ncbi:hypothetical protein ACIHFD_34505 [Nonomuraea sp. NPDC051941]|uniref:hypothetical protein n=1 Tax=Nonomuraea sp. NPDC051941 TaxID=3364373 RepID=UPI0037C6A2CD